MTQITNEVIARRVRLTRKGAIILAIILGLFIAIGRSDAYLEAKDMLANGVAVDATIVEKKHWVETGRKNRQYDRYALVYQFSDPTGASTIQEVRTNEENFQQVSEGDAISVIYKSDQPSINNTRTHYEYQASITNIVKDVLLVVVIVIVAGYIIGFFVNKKMRKKMAAELQAKQA